MAIASASCYIHLLLFGNLQCYIKTFCQSALDKRVMCVTDQKNKSINKVIDFYRLIVTFIVLYLFEVMYGREVYPLPRQLCIPSYNCTYYR